MIARAALANARAAEPLSEDQCLIWFGVGLATIERVEAGEVEPGDELAARIERFLLARPAPPTDARFLNANGGGFTLSPADPRGGGALEHGAGVAGSNAR